MPPRRARGRGRGRGRGRSRDVGAPDIASNAPHDADEVLEPPRGRRRLEEVAPLVPPAAPPVPPDPAVPLVAPPQFPPQQADMAVILQRLDVIQREIADLRRARQRGRRGQVQRGESSQGRQTSSETGTSQRFLISSTEQRQSRQPQPVERRVDSSARPGVSSQDRPSCPHCGKIHGGSCRYAPGTCWHCRQQGHMRRDCPMRAGSALPPSVSQPSGQASSQSSRSITGRGRGRGPGQSSEPAPVGRGQGRVFSLTP